MPRLVLCGGTKGVARLAQRFIYGTNTNCQGNEKQSGNKIKDRINK